MGWVKKEKKMSTKVQRSARQKKMSATLLFASAVLFVLGLYFYVDGSRQIWPLNEAFTLSRDKLELFKERRCPNVLIQKGAQFHLYNNRMATVPGVNPVIFNNLEEYTEFLDWQRSQGIRCPVLYLQQSYDAQGKTVLTMRPSVREPQGGLNPSASAPIGIASTTQPTIFESGEQPRQAPNPTLLVDAGRSDDPYNSGSYPAYDASSFYVGTTTPLDEMDRAQEQAPISDNPMDPNWGGQQYTQDLVDRGYYRNYEVQYRQH